MLAAAYAAATTQSIGVFRLRNTKRFACRSCTACVFVTSCSQAVNMCAVRCSNLCLHFGSGLSEMHSHSVVPRRVKKHLPRAWRYIKGELATRLAGPRSAHSKPCFHGSPLGRLQAGFVLPNEVVCTFRVVCDLCERADFGGTRYTCTVCQDFDLCEGCLHQAVPVSRGGQQHDAGATVWTHANWH